MLIFWGETLNSLDILANRKVTRGNLLNFWIDLYKTCLSPMTSSNPQYSSSSPLFIYLYFWVLCVCLDLTLGSLWGSHRPSTCENILDSHGLRWPYTSDMLLKKFHTVCDPSLFKSLNASNFTSIFHLCRLSIKFSYLQWRWDTLENDYMSSFQWLICNTWDKWPCYLEESITFFWASSCCKFG